MNTSRKCRNGNRKLNRRWGSYVIRRLDGRPYRPTDWLAVACSAMKKFLRLRKKAAKEDPHLFGPHANRYFEDTRRLEQERVEVEAALERVYGPDYRPVSPTRVWYERYYEDPANKKIFLKWFKEFYGT